MSDSEIDDASDFVLPGHSEDLDKLFSHDFRINFNATRSAQSIPCQSADFSEDIRDMAVFDDPRILKGSCVWQLMHGAAKIFANREGSAESYELSRIQQSLDAFISHNWCVPQRRKYYCLLSHYNAFPAFVAGFVASSAVVVLIAVGFVPLIDIKRDGDIFEYPKRSFGACVHMGHITFMITLFTYHELRLCVTGWHGPAVFLDKTCIH